MADGKTSELPAVVTPVGSDQFAVSQSGVSKQMTLAQIVAFALTDGYTGTITVVVDMNKSGTMLQKKTQQYTYSKGILTTVGAESGWIDVGEFGGY